MPTTTPQAPIIIAIAGGPASGKKSVAAALKSTLESLHAAPFTVATLHQRDFPRDPSVTASSSFDSERPEAYDLDALLSAVPSADVVIIEGTYVLTSAKILERAAVKIFVDCDSDVRLARRVVRDLERGTPLDSIFEQHVRFAKTCYERTILPTKQLSDIILPGGGSWAAGVELIAHGVVDDIVGRKGRGAGTGAPVIGGQGSLAGLPLMLCEADLGFGVPSYYETV